MNKKGYTMPELLVVLGFVTVIAIISIIKVSFAFSDINNNEEIEKQEELLIEKASLWYAKTIENRIKDEKVVYVSGEELINSKFLTDENEYKNLKIKLYYNETNDEIKYELISGKK